MGEAKPCFSFIYFLILSFSTSLSLIHSYLTCSNMRLLLLLPFKDHFECCCLSLSSISCSCFYWFNLYFYCNDLPIPLSLSLSLSRSLRHLYCLPGDILPHAALFCCLAQYYQHLLLYHSLSTFQPFIKCFYSLALYSPIALSYSLSVSIFQFFISYFYCIKVLHCFSPRFVASNNNRDCLERSKKASEWVGAWRQRCTAAQLHSCRDKRCLHSPLRNELALCISQIIRISLERKYQLATSFAQRLGERIISLLGVLPS